MIDLVVYIIFIIAIVLILILFSCTLIAYYRACRRNQEDLKRWNKTFLEKGQELKKLTIELEEARAQIHREDISEDRDVLNAQKKLILEDITKTRAELEQVQGQLKEVNLALATGKDSVLQATNNVHDLERQIAVLEPQKKNLEENIAKLSNELQRLLNLQKVIDDNENNVVWSPILTEKEAKLIDLLHELINMYPDLKIEFATIEWKKIWMPQLQQLGSAIDGKRGIYRLILRDKREGENSSYAVEHSDLSNTSACIKVLDADGNTKTMPVCYVGQAVDIKDRWYTHVKKMIGVAAKGNEKVYNYRPEDFYWCIIEEGNNVNLNESEKYWISYYCAKDGLNKKM